MAHGAGRAGEGGVIAVRKTNPAPTVSLFSIVEETYTATSMRAGLSLRREPMTPAGQLIKKGKKAIAVYTDGSHFDWEADNTTVLHLGYGTQRESVPASTRSCTKRSCVTGA